MSTQLLIILLYFILTIVIGVVSSRKSKSSDSFHGAGLGVIMCVAAGTGEWLGGTSTTGVAEYGFTYGISGAWYTISNGIGVIILALFLAKLYRSLNTVTVPGIVENYLGPDARTVSSVLLIFVMVMVGTSQVIAIGTLGVSLLGLEYNMSVLLFGAGIIVYTLAGGMNAVATTNVLHLFTMYGGVVLALIVVGRDVGGLQALSTALPAVPYFSWFGIGVPKVSSWIIASILGACTAQAGIQPILAARDENVAKKAAIITAFLVAPFGILTALLGMAAKVKFPELANAKMALPTLMMSMQPVVGGIVLASIIAAILSTISPIILASGTMFTKDLYEKKISPNADDKKVLGIARFSTAIAGVVCIGLAILMYGSTMILDMVYFAYTIRGSLFVILLLAIYLKKRSPKAAIYSMIVTALVGVFWVAFKGITGSYPIHPYITETYASVIVAFASAMILNQVFKSDDSKDTVR